VRVRDIKEDVQRLKSMLNEKSSNNSLSSIEGLDCEKSTDFNSEKEYKTLLAKFNAVAKQNKLLQSSLKETKSRVVVLHNNVKNVESARDKLKDSLCNIETEKKELEKRAEFMEEEQFKLLNELQNKLHEKAVQFGAE